MTKEILIRKFTSRKLWAAVALFVSGLIVAFNGSANTAETVSGCIMQAGAVISYIFAEGWADASGGTVYIPEAEEPEEVQNKSDTVVEGFCR